MVTALFIMVCISFVFHGTGNIFRSKGEAKAAYGAETLEQLSQVAAIVATITYWCLI